VVVAAILGALFWERRRRQRQQQQQLLPLTTDSAKSYRHGSASSGRHLSTKDSDDFSDSATGVGPRRCGRLQLLYRQPQLIGLSVVWPPHASKVVHLCCCHAPLQEAGCPLLAAAKAGSCRYFLMFELQSNSFALLPCCHPLQETRRPCWRWQRLGAALTS
jgi:hypothetical protein